MSEQIKENASNESPLTELGDVGLPEDLARADLYGLIARLFHQPPDQELLDQIAASIPDGQENQVDDAPLAKVWNSVVEVAKNNSAKAWHEEFDRNFISVGRPNVILNGSFYMAGHLNEKPLVDIRRALEVFGLESAEDVTETEDHLSALCEVMRYLIAGDDVAVANLTHQMAFFNQHVQPWVSLMCQSLQAHPRAVFYARVAAFTTDFMSVEAQGFDLLT